MTEGEPKKPGSWRPLPDSLNAPLKSLVEEVHRIHFAYTQADRRLQATRGHLAEAQRTIEQLQGEGQEKRQQIGMLEQLLEEQQAELQHSEAHSAQLREQLKSEQEAHCKVLQELEELRHRLAAQPESTSQGLRGAREQEAERGTPDGSACAGCVVASEAQLGQLMAGNPRPGSSLQLDVPLVANANSDCPDRAELAGPPRPPPPQQQAAVVAVTAQPAAAAVAAAARLPAGNAGSTRPSSAGLPAAGPPCPPASVQPAGLASVFGDSSSQDEGCPAYPFSRSRLLGPSLPAKHDRKDKPAMSTGSPVLSPAPPLAARMFIAAAQIQLEAQALSKCPASTPGAGAQAAPSEPAPCAQLARGTPPASPTCPRSQQEQQRPKDSNSWRGPVEPNATAEHGAAAAAKGGSRGAGWSLGRPSDAEAPAQRSSPLLTGKQQRQQQHQQRVTAAFWGVACSLAPGWAGPTEGRAPGGAPQPSAAASGAPSGSPDELRWSGSGPGEHKGPVGRKRRHAALAGPVWKSPRRRSGDPGSEAASGDGASASESGGRSWEGGAEREQRRRHHSSGGEGAFVPSEDRQDGEEEWHTGGSEDEGEEGGLQQVPAGGRPKRRFTNSERSAFIRVVSEHGLDLVRLMAALPGRKEATIKKYWENHGAQLGLHDAMQEEEQGASVRLLGRRMQQQQTGKPAAQGPKYTPRQQGGKQVGRS